MKIHSRFLLSSSDARQFPPPGVPEVAFLGRSNVGKSSLINALVGAKIAKTSNLPGRTQSINFFEIRWPGRPKPELLFVDLPGYGYARVPREVSGQWQSFVDPYLTERPSLSLCLCLVDANVPPQKSDAQLIDFLRHADRPFVVVATKADKVGSRLPASLNALRQELGIETLPFSAKTGLGKDELWKLMRSVADGQGHESLESAG
jgi:GTP-binding protein